MYRENIGWINGGVHLRLLTRATALVDIGGGGVESESSLTFMSSRYNHNTDIFIEYWFILFSYIDK